MPPTYLQIGGLVAVGFDSTHRYLLTVSHSGRGVYDISSWTRVARDITLAYPTDGVAEGIGPIAGEPIQVVEIDYDTGIIDVANPRGDFRLHYEQGTLEIQMKM